MAQIGIIAGAGDLPIATAKLAVAKGLTPSIISLDNRNLSDFAPCEARHFAVTQIEAIISHFVSQNIVNVVTVGKVERPQLTADLIIDETAKQLLLQSHGAGDDAVLSAILSLMQQSGLQVIPISSLLADHKLPANYDNNIGPAPSQAGLATAKTTHARLGDLDVGQALVAQGERIIAIEAAEGTDEMIKRTADYLMDSRDALFLKASKSNQNKLLDPPVFGAQTLALCISSGIRIIALEAEHCLLAIPLSELEDLCEAHQIRLISLTQDEAP